MTPSGPDVPLPETRLAIVVPLYNHGGTALEVVRGAARPGYPVYLVDDGSTDGGAEGAERVEGVTVLRHCHNRGKGAALKTGFAAAREVADWAVTLDADGQHDPADIPNLVAAIPDDGSRPIIVGRRRGMDSPNTPWTSRFGRSFSNFWIRAAGGHRVTDSQSGFRVYPLPETLDLCVPTDHYQFEVEVLVKARWRGLPVLEVPVAVSYGPPGQRISHFEPWRDFWRNSGTFSRLLISRPLRPAQGDDDPDDR